MAQKLERVWVCNQCRYTWIQHVRYGPLHPGGLVYEIIPARCSRCGGCTLYGSSQRSKMFKAQNKVVEDHKVK